MVEALRMPQKTRSTAVAARRAALQMIRADIISAPEELRDQLRGMTRMQLIRHLVATRPDSTGFRTPLGAAKIALKRLAKRYVDLDDEVSELDDMIDAILADAAPLLVQLKCVGAQSAAQLMVTVGDNPERIRSEASFAMLCGVAPVPVSSGMTYRRRLNRGGDRQANSAIRIIAIGRLRTDERTKEYVAKKMSECRTGSHVASVAVVTAIGCDEDGWRRVLGLDVVDTESYDSWLGFLQGLRARGVHGVELVTSDAHTGLKRAISEVFQGAAWQRCVVHLIRSCAREAGRGSLARRVARIVAPAFRAKDAGTVRAMYHVACEMLEACCPRAAALLEEAEPDALAYLAFPQVHWKRLRTNNVQERANREIKRRRRVVQVFPSEKSLLRLAGAVMCDQDEAWSEARYFSAAKMAELHDEQKPEPAEPPSAERREQALAFARQAIEASLALADRMEAA